MSNPDRDCIEQIQARIVTLQQAHVTLQEEFKQSQNKVENIIQESALRLIDILDLLDTAQKTNTADPCPHTAVIVKKVEKRLMEILKRWEVQEINLSEGRTIAGKTRVLQTQPKSSEKPPGSIIEICRKGYERRNKTIRAVDVITSG